MPRASPLIAMLPILLIAVAGCSTKTYPAEGTIVYTDGKPAKQLAGGTIFFQHVDGKTSAAGDIDENGGFRLHFGEQEGAPAGEYRVYFAPPGQVQGEGDAIPQPVKINIDKRYLSPTDSPLRETVKAEPNTFTLKIERAK